MALDQKFFKKSTAAGSGLTDQEEGLVLHLDANDVDSYDGDGSIWYDIVGHEVNIPLASDDNNNLKIHYDPSNTNSYSGLGTTLTNLAGNSLNATVVASRFDNDYDSGLKGYFDISTQSEATIVIPSGHPLNGDFTLEFWFRWQGTPGSGGHRFINESGQNIGFFYYKSLGWRFYQASGQDTGYYGGSSGGIQGNVWQHKVITFSGSSFKGYLDGNQIGSTSYTRPSSSLGSFNFGTTNITADKPDCDIGAIRMYDRALTAAEVGQNFRAGNNFSYSSIITSKHEATQGTLYTTNLELHLDANGYSGSGNWLDSSGNSRNGVINGATYVNNNNADYFTFDGSDDNIKISSSGLVNSNGVNFSVEAWAKNRAASNNHIVTQTSEDGNSQNWLIRFHSDNTIKFYVYGTDEYLGTSDTFELNRWYHIVCVVESDGIVRIYVDGVLKSSSNSGKSADTQSYNTFIGSLGGQQHAPVDVAQVRINDEAMTPAQIKTNYDATKELYQNPTALIDYRIDQYSGSGTSIANLGSLSNNAAELLGSLNYDKEVGDFFNIEGSGDGITTSQAVAINPSTDGMTIEIWFMITSDVQNYLFSFDGTGTTYNGLSYRANTNKILWFYRTGSGAYTGINTPIITLNKWHHLVATTSGSNAEIYLDGVVSETTTADAYSENYNEDLHFGNYQDLAQNSNSKIGDMRFYKGHISAAQVAQNYLATKNKYPNGINFTGSNISWNANGYFSFNGSNTKFGTSGAPSALINATGFTVSAWLWRTNNATGSNTIVGQSHDNGNSGQNWILTVSGSGTVYFHIYGNDDYSGVNNLVSYETWTHLAGVVEDDGVKRIYKNGVVQLSTASGKSADTVSYNTFVGNLGAINWHDGRIGAVKYYKKPLTADELLADFNATKGTYGL